MKDGFKFCYYFLENKTGCHKYTTSYISMQVFKLLKIQFSSIDHISRIITKTLIFLPTHFRHIFFLSNLAHSGTLHLLGRMVLYFRSHNAGCNQDPKNQVRKLKKGKFLYCFANSKYIVCISFSVKDFSIVTALC